LVIVLWMVLLVSAIASGFAVSIFTETSMARYRVDATQARLLAEAGVYHAILELLRSDREQAWPVDGSANLLDLGTAKVSVRIRDAAGLVDLNNAAPDTLRRLFEHVGMDKEETEALVDVLLDWRDRDDLRHLKGAEDRDYLAAGRAYGTPDEPFSSAEELRYLLGVTPSLFDRLAPYLTVYSGRRGIDPDVAPPALRAGVEARDDAADAPDPRGGAPGRVPRRPGVARTGSVAYHISARVHGEGGGAGALEVVVRINPRGPRRFQILSWHEPRVGRDERGV
jgi:general secretion pathway protein K